MASVKNLKKFLSVYGVPLANVLIKECNISQEDSIKYVAQGIKTVIENIMKESREENKESKENKESVKKSKKTTTKSRKKSKPEIICEYIYVRSPKKGERCSSLVDKKSTKFCSKHISKETDKQETKDDKKDKKKTVEKIKSEKTRKMNDMSEKLQSFINSSIPLIKIERNNDGLYLLQDTRIIINPSTLEAYGYLNDENNSVELRKNDIEMCKELNIKYQLPSNLSDSVVNTKLQDDEKDDCHSDLEDGIEGYSDIESDLETED